MTKNNPFKKNKYEIIYNVINSLLAGLLIFFGSCLSGDISLKAIAVALFASVVIAITKFKEYWDKQISEYDADKLNVSRLFSFINS